LLNNGCFPDEEEDEKRKGGSRSKRREELKEGAREGRCKRRMEH
jgi:hypothetical protein